MIPAVNLLPWRDGQRRRRNRLFGLQLGGVFAAALALIGLFALHLDGVADGQRKRNDFLQESIAEFDRRIEQVERLRHRRRELGVRIEAIQALEARRGTVVRMLEEIVNTLPVGVHYQAMDLRGDVLALRGVASSNQDVSALMRNLQECPWFAEPRLLNIKDAAPDGLPEGSSAMNGQGSAINGQGSAFSMTVVRVPLSAAPRAAPVLAATSAVAASSARGH
ncbi:MAG: pilus assembly protein PilN [Gammaproteobacteria bacterium]|nr:pilus assembly protein PilN [Gammaproteobacteria bacterium]